MITKQQALEALENMDDYARMSVGVDAKGPREVLRAYIEQAEPMADGWISIEQGSMPPLGEQVLVWCKYGPHWGPMVDCWDEQHEAPLSFSSATIPIGPGWDSGSEFEDVTYWMRIGSPVTAAPKEPT